MNHYHTLGVIQSAEAAVIKAAYKALASIYHPDKNTGSDAPIKMQRINEAYSILSDPQKRKAYDVILESSDESPDASDFDPTKPFIEDPLSEKWEIAVRFNPAIDSCQKKLERLSWILGFSYKVQLLETQKFKDYLSIAQEFRFQYLSKYFGKNNEIINYAEEYILAKEIPAALYLNKVMVVMGSTVELYQLKREMQKQHAKSVNKIIGIRLYKSIVTVDSSGYKFYIRDPAVRLVEINEGKVNIPFWGKIKTEIDGKKITHANSDSFCLYVLDLYSKKYT